MDNTKQWIRCSGLTGCNHKEGVCTASPEYQAQFAKPVPTMDNTNAVLADRLGAVLAQLDEVVMTDTERARVLIENYEALRQPTQTDALREALEAAPIISQWEGPAEFRARQDEWLQGKYKTALEASNG